MKILVKFPTRERAAKFLNTLSGYQRNQVTDQVQYLITCDENDRGMNNVRVKGIMRAMSNTDFVFGTSSSKIDAINRDMDQAGKWNIVVLASDDMICQVSGWDEQIINAMKEAYPNTDGCLWFHDGDKATERKLCTMVIMGRKYWNRFKYIYHPSYKSLWCDNEYTQVAERLGKITFFPQVLFKHIHFSNNRGLRADALMNRNQAFYHEDEETFKQRKSINFEL